MFKAITSQEAVSFLLPRHYSGRKPQISFSFGAYEGTRLMAVCTFGKPASNALCKGVCGVDYSPRVYELNRLCREEEYSAQLSKFVGWCLRQLSDLIIVSYADTDMSHNGYIYQACNFLYTGETKGRTDKYTEGNKHSRHYSNEAQQGVRKIRSPKHRYIYFCTKNRKLRKTWLSHLNYPVLPYPKKPNGTYKLGTYQTVKLTTALYIEDAISLL